MVAIKSFTTKKLFLNQPACPQPKVIPSTEGIRVNENPKAFMRNIHDEVQSSSPPAQTGQIHCARPPDGAQVFTEMQKVQAHLDLLGENTTLCSETG